MSARKLVLDLDTGIDDALAIAYALGSPEVELVAVTACFGNVAAERGARNALALLDLLGHPEVPVYLGATHARTAEGPFVPSAPVRRIHGDNGLGGCAVPDARDEPVRAEGPDGNAAADYLVEAVERYGDDLIYVPTGPLTNLAAALEAAPALAGALPRVTFMGGALTVPGNVTPCAEANVANDPEAADLVLRSGLPLRMVGLDVTHQALLSRERARSWLGLGTPAAEAYVEMCEHYIGAYARNNPYLGGCCLHDPLAVGAAIDPTLVGCLPINLKVDLDGAVRGRTIGDDERLNDVEKTCEAAVLVDARRFVGEFMTRVGRALVGGR